MVRNAKSAGETVIAIPQEVAESGSAAGAGKTVLKAIPVAIIRPLIGASGAVSNTLMGIHNTLDSNQQRNIEDVSIIEEPADKLEIQALIAFFMGRDIHGCRSFR